MTVSFVKRACASLLLGAGTWTICLGSLDSLERLEVFAWVADRDAGCVVALDQDLLELEAWVVPRPAALARVDQGVLVKESGGVNEEVWWRLERGARPVCCRAPEGERDLLLEPGLTPQDIQGVPTAWVQAGCATLVATPGAVHRFSKDGDLERVQGGFRWISAVTLSEQSSPKGQQRWLRWNTRLGSSHGVPSSREALLLPALLGRAASSEPWGAPRRGGWSPR